MANRGAISENHFRADTGLGGRGVEGKVSTDLPDFNGVTGYENGKTRLPLFVRDRTRPTENRVDGSGSIDFFYNTRSTLRNKILTIRPSVNYLPLK